MFTRIHFLIQAIVLLFALMVAPLGFAKDWVYSVKPGDSIWKICERYAYYEPCWLELGEYNDMTSADRLAVGAQLRLPVEWLQLPVAAAHVTYFSGDVSVHDKKGKPKTLVRDMQLEVGDRLLVGEGQLDLRFSDGSTMSVSRQSEIVIDAVSAIKQTRQSTVEVSLPKGSATVRVPRAEPRNRFRVKTSSGVAAVRGTEFRVRNNEAQTLARSEVVEGRVGFRAQAVTVDIEEGFGALAEKGKAPSEPVKLLPPPQWVEQCEAPGMVEWYPIDNADYYLLDVYSPEEGGAQLVDSMQTSDSFNRFEQLDNGCYELALKGVRQGFYGYESRMPYCYEYEISAPEIKNAILEDKVLSLELFQMQYGESIEIELSESADFSSVSKTLVIQQETTEVNVGDANYMRARTLGRNGEFSDYSKVHTLGEDQPFAAVWGILAVIAAVLIL